MREEEVVRGKERGRGGSCEGKRGERRGGSCQTKVGEVDCHQLSIYKPNNNPFVPFFLFLHSI